MVLYQQNYSSLDSTPSAVWFNFSLLHWVGQKVSLVFSVENVHFSFSSITVLIWVFLVCRLSPVWYNIDCSQFMSGIDRYQFQLVYLIVEHRSVRNL